MTDKFVTVKMECEVTFKLTDFHEDIYSDIRYVNELSEIDGISDKHIQLYFEDNAPEDLIDCVGMDEYEIKEVIVK